MTATSAQSPLRIGRMAAEVVYEILEGKPYLTNIVVPVNQITQEDILRYGTEAGNETENLSIGLRVLYHAIEWLTVFLILLIFAVQIITPLYAVRVGRADSFLQQLQWLPYRPVCLPWA